MSGKPGGFFVALWEYDQRACLSDEQYRMMERFLAWMATEYQLEVREDAEQAR